MTERSMVDPTAATAAAGRFIGQSVQRREDPRLVSGHGVYLDDVIVPGIAHVACVRSDVARARIRGLDVSAPPAAAGVRAVPTAADLAPMIHGPLSATMFLGAPIATLRTLADGAVRFAGEA